ncbi:MAG: small multi-drug export protein [Clostridia bacterium]|nr:small multi-drug export protein [Clostridia bacterium]
MADYLINLFSNVFPSEIVIFILSLIPTIELRGGILAAKFLNVEMIKAFFICFFGTLVPIPFVLLFLEKIMDFFKNTKFVQWLNRKAEKNRGKIEKYKTFGLMLFVAIPLPGTGAWTGALAAVVLKMDIKHAALSIIVGSLIADIIMCLVSYGALGLIF